MNYLAVKDYASFQHYKDRNPPWIKLYFAVLEDYAFLQLGEPTQRHLFMLWLIASRHDGYLPNDRKYLSVAIKARGRVDFDALIASGFLAVVDAETRESELAERKQDASKDASTPLAERKQDAIASCARESQRQRTTPPNPPEAGASAKRQTAAPWMGEIREVWHEPYPGDEPPKGTAKTLAPLVAKHGVDAVVGPLRNYLAATEAKYLNLAKFAATFGSWAGGGNGNGFGRKPSSSGTWNEPLSPSEMREMNEEELVRINASRVAAGVEPLTYAEAYRG